MWRRRKPEPRREIAGLPEGWRASLTKERNKVRWLSFGGVQFVSVDDLLDLLSETASESACSPADAAVLMAVADAVGVASLRIELEDK